MRYSFDSLCFVLGCTSDYATRLILAGDFPPFDGRGYPNEGVDTWLEAHGEMLPPGRSFHAPHLGYVAADQANSYVAAGARGLGAGGGNAVDGASAGVAGPAAYASWQRRMAMARREWETGCTPDGSYTGDGIPRTVGGRPYEPLEWSQRQVSI